MTKKNLTGNTAPVSEGCKFSLRPLREKVVEDRMRGKKRKVINMFDNYSDKELMELFYTAIETQDGRYYKAIKEEMNRREREQ